MADKKKIKVDGKEYDLNQFDDTRSWGKQKKSKVIKTNTSSLPNILGRV